MRVRITHSLRGVVDGIDLSRYLEGLTYDLGTTLSNYLLAQGWAVPVGEDAATAVLPLHASLVRHGVLVVDDDVDVREILSQALALHGWHPHLASDGHQGLTALKQHRPSLVLLDLAMPRMNGIEFRSAQRRLPDAALAATPVVVLSALHDAPRFKSTLDVADVLLKPFDLDRLMGVVESYVPPINLFRW